MGRGGWLETLKKGKDKASNGLMEVLVGRSWFPPPPLHFPLPHPPTRKACILSSATALTSPSSSRQSGLDCRRPLGTHQLAGDAVPPDQVHREAQGGQSHRVETQSPPPRSYPFRQGGREKPRSAGVSVLPSPRRQWGKLEGSAHL